MFYAGIGSRKTPPDVLTLMTTIAAGLRIRGLILRSGAAEGADMAFEAGANEMKRIYLPWTGFNGRSLRERCVPVPSSLDNRRATEVSSKIHPNWINISEGARKLHKRNFYQIHGNGEEYTKSICVICWTPDGCEDGKLTSSVTGGTGQALRLATASGIPIFNLFHTDSLDRLKAFVKEIPK